MDPTSPLVKAGVKGFNAPGYSAQFAEYANLSNAIVVPTTSAVVHITGQLGANDDGTLPPAVEDELRQAFRRVEENLVAAGCTQGWKNVYKCVAYHSPDLSEERLGIYASLIKEFCGSNKPSQTSVSVPSLWDGAHIEITVEAVVG
ncbi:hypothetical protein G7054_g1353 [Neopestalotiopsis clavispora]|nr:hypothetical protein G7054_g1353 [Neopestalotiopsis clavispora]